MVDRLQSRNPGAARMIKPYASQRLLPRFVDDAKQRAALAAEAEQLPSVIVSSAAAANAVMLGGGYFTPLRGYMNRADALSIAQSMHTADGLFWPAPILNLLPDTSGLGDARRIALRDPNVAGNPVIAVQDVTAVDTLSDDDIDAVCEGVYRTGDSGHPGVAAFRGQGRHAVAGDIEVLNFSYFQQDFPDTFRTAVEIRSAIDASGWQRVVAFQTRNPMHRAHEELCKMAMQAVNADGVVIHMLLGKLKPGDIPATVRDAAIRKMVDLYFEPNTAMITGYGFDMLYAGPREAVLHAIFRQNMGATHFIIGRDHAGVGDYYGAFDAQSIFDDEVPPGTLDIEIFRADHTAYSKILERVVMMRDAPDHSPEDFVLLSGTKVREMLGNGIAPPPEFSRPEVAQILMDHYRSEAG
jgi:sulfate adenylyltransferase